MIETYLPSRLYSIGVIAGFFIVLLKYLTRFRVKWVPAVRGGILFSLLWWIASAGFQIYLVSAAQRRLRRLLCVDDHRLVDLLHSLILLLSVEYAYAWHKIREGKA